MKVIIIEDELLAQAKLEAMLHSLDKSIEVHGEDQQRRGSVALAFIAPVA